MRISRLSAALEPHANGFRIVRRVVVHSFVFLFIKWFTRAKVHKIFLTAAIFLRFFFTSSEQREVHATILPMLHEVGMGREVMVFTMLENEHAALRQQVLLEHEVRQQGQFTECIGRIGKDKVELLVAALDESEHISTKRQAGCRAEFLQTINDETVMVAILLHADHTGTPS